MKFTITAHYATDIQGCICVIALFTVKEEVNIIFLAYSRYSEITCLLLLMYWVECTGFSYFIEKG